MIDPFDIINKFYSPGSRLYSLLVAHGRQVARKSLLIAEKTVGLAVDMAFLEEAALLHDIGIIGVRAPQLGCVGRADYICHGVIGREMLSREGLERHGLVCERHVGVGLTEADIAKNNFSLPMRDMRPVSLEEIIIAYADKFFSKNATMPEREKSVDEVASHLSQYGRDVAERFLAWARRFGEA